jgi:hypothetical protein
MAVNNKVLTDCALSFAASVATSPCRTDELLQSAFFNVDENTYLLID